MNDHQLRAFISGQDEDSSAETTPLREIHAIESLPPPPPWPSNRGAWEARSHVSSNSLSMASDNFTTMSREFSALVIAGSAMENEYSAEHHGTNHQTETRSRSNNSMLLGMIGEGRGEVLEETNPLAMVHQQDLSSDMPPLASAPGRIISVGQGSSSLELGEISVQRVKEEEIEAKITAWQNAKVAKINNRFKREETVIGAWENAQVDRASASIKKVERKLEEKRAKALEKMHNDIAMAHRKAAEKRASAEAKRGTKVGKVFEICNLMRALGRIPSERTFF